jgi:hypothetical protein
MNCTRPANFSRSTLSSAALHKSDQVLKKICCFQNLVMDDDTDIIDQRIAVEERHKVT